MKHNANVVFRDLDGEAVILDLESGTYFGLNEVGTRLWQLAGEGRSETEIVDTLVAEYDADRETIVRDATKLLEELRRRRLIVPDEDARP
jgi:hypothetical protein